MEKYFNRKAFGILLIVFLLVVIFEIWMVNRLSLYGEQISRIEKTSSELQMENQILKNTIDEYSSLFEIGKRAKLLGFEAVKNIENITKIK